MITWAVETEFKAAWLHAKHTPPSPVGREEGPSSGKAKSGLHPVPGQPRGLGLPVSRGAGPSNRVSLSFPSPIALGAEEQTGAERAVTPQAHSLRPSVVSSCQSVSCLVAAL